MRTSYRKKDISQTNQQNEQKQESGETTNTRDV